MKPFHSNSTRGKRALLSALALAAAAASAQTAQTAQTAPAENAKQPATLPEVKVQEPAAAQRELHESRPAFARGRRDAQRPARYGRLLPQRARDAGARGSAQGAIGPAQRHAAQGHDWSNACAQSARHGPQMLHRSGPQKVDVHDATTLPFFLIERNRKKYVYMLAYY